MGILSMTELENAEQYVTEGRRVVTEQREKVDRLTATGGDIYAAAQELRFFQDSLAIFEDHLLWLRTAQP
jgi:hypothetical protein